MKILYGVQGTGNGHLSRAMAMAEAFQDYPQIQTDWLISGRENGSSYPGLPSYMWRRGLTLVTRNGRVSISRTLKENSFLRFWRDTREISLDGYDMVISDYEPVISHAARRAGIPVTGISHQCAFDYPIPMAGADRASLALLRHFAPVTTAIGLHWHPFGHPILPPILHRRLMEAVPTFDGGKVLVYLPMENPRKITDLLLPLSRWQFVFYHPQNSNHSMGNVHTREISTEGFREDLRTASFVICNSGFELISECLYMGKPVLAKPLKRQMEQLSNARALEVLGYASVTGKLNSEVIANWLESMPTGISIRFPDVPARLARWIAAGCKESAAELSTELWAGLVKDSLAA